MKIKKLKALGRIVRGLTSEDESEWEQILLTVARLIEQLSEITPTDTDDKVAALLQRIAARVLASKDMEPDQ